MGHTDATGVSSSPVTIDVECTDAPQSLFTDVTVGYSKHTQVGGEASIRVYGKYPDNPDVDLTDSTLTTYATSSKGIIAMERDGQFKGLAPGSTSIVIHHRNLSVTLKVVVRE
jgi:hypothetical protein